MSIAVHDKSARPAPTLDVISGVAQGSFVCGVFIGFAQSNIFHFFFTFSCVACSYISLFETCFRDVFSTFPVFFVWRLYRPLYKTYFFVFFHETRASEKKVECGVVIALFHSFGFGAKTHFFSLCLCGVVM